jgi:hypothetical protein
MRETKTLDNVSCVLDNNRMPTYEEILRSMIQNLKYEHSRITEGHEQMTQNEEAHRRFVDAQRDVKSREERLQRLFAILGLKRIADSINDPMKMEEILERVEPESDTEKSSDSLSLWEAVREYLIIAEEGSLAEIVRFLRYSGIKATRQAIESALKQHPETFKTRKKEREKYVSLKEQ